MNDDAFDLLVSRWLTGETSEEDEARLFDRLGASEEARLRFAELADQEAALRVLSQSVVQAEEIREQENSEEPRGSDTTRTLLVRNAARRRWRRGPGDSRHAFWIAGIAAAGILFGLVLFASLLISRPASRPPVVQQSPPEPEAIARDESPPVPPVPPGREPEKLLPPAPAPPDSDRKRSPETELRRPPEIPPRVPQPPPTEPPRKKDEEPTRVAAAKLERVEGEVIVISESGRTDARAGLPILPGQGLETGASGSATLVYADGTRVEVKGDTALAEIFDSEPPAKGKRARVHRGTIAAVVTRQPADQPVVFATPHGRATVVGTILQIVVTAARTRLEVTEGKVRLTGGIHGKSVDVSAGQFAEANGGGELAARPLPTDEILLLPHHAKLGGDWGRMKDPRAVTGTALEVRQWWSAAESEARFRKKELGYVDFTFHADADKDYSVWIRGCCMVDAPDVKDRFGRDMVVIDALDAKCVSKVLPTCLDNRAYGYTGYAYKPGYSWIGGYGDPGPTGGWLDAVPVTFRFSRTGKQVMRMYTYESPIRIDAVWLSATQKTRPAEDQKGPKSP